VPFEHAPTADYIPTIWAGRKIAYLIDQIRLHGESSEMVEEIVRLGTTYGIQTPYSSWYVNPEASQGTEIAMRRLRVQQNFEQNRQIPESRRGATSVSMRDGGGMGAGGGGGLFGDPEDDSAIPMADAERAVTEGTGRAANVIARAQAASRASQAADVGRQLRTQQIALNVNGRDYQRLGRVLVDEELREETPVETIRFGSEAYFELVRNRADLRTVLAMNTENLVLVSENQAILILEDEGEEKLSEELRQEIGRVER
jgi:Ca-activated chloride channel family protein